MLNAPSNASCDVNLRDDFLNGGDGKDFLDGGLGTDRAINGETVINVP